MTEKEKIKRDTLEYYSHGKTFDEARERIEKKKTDEKEKYNLDLKDLVDSEFVVRYGRVDDKENLFQGKGNTENEAIADARKRHGRDISQEYKVIECIIYETFKVGTQKSEEVNTNRTPPSAGEIKESSYTLDDKVFGI